RRRSPERSRSRTPPRWGGGFPAGSRPARRAAGGAASPRRRRLRTGREKGSGRRRTSAGRRRAPPPAGRTGPVRCCCSARSRNAPEGMRGGRRSFRERRGFPIRQASGGAVAGTADAVGELVQTLEVLGAEDQIHGAGVV